MSTTIQKTKELQKEKARTTFIVCDDKESTRTLIKAESLDETVDKAEKNGLKPRYVVEEELVACIEDEERKYSDGE
ncbi:hypothetical protein AKJ37_00750 [candidate division MSBL1 archaeon SCGC-AAA259I09]|uniref:Uncharacterized protein n=3 Tax=candidate division MSBL1 TaxID=215777 RepID=A0A133UWW7_9EURY|nr:hypothetical protein AKJ65_04235 [candidate division MSBL1 archaeon SCGC-AAA259E19]KXA98231.1 hypothetical protein AKJ37_00750 [candidate division MSBL1 archaeon SCGC-AAA259I09]KXA98669.1 hypothetical protein AKJ41_06410 [candidate division MSBL1 archaeon SCGC-AAA259O05]